MRDMGAVTYTRTWAPLSPLSQSIRCSCFATFISTRSPANTRPHDDDGTYAHSSHRRDSWQTQRYWEGTDIGKGFVFYCFFSCPILFHHLSFQISSADTCIKETSGDMDLLVIFGGGAHAGNTKLVVLRRIRSEGCGTNYLHAGWIFAITLLGFFIFYFFFTGHDLIPRLIFPSSYPLFGCRAMLRC